MSHKDLLLQRLNDIAASLARRNNTLALIGLGSIGTELDRMDDYSDLDFFVIVQSGAKSGLLENLVWLSAIRPIAYCFRNTVDGYKLLFDDGVFCEFAVFEPNELAHIPFARGRIIWKTEAAPESMAIPLVPMPVKTPPTTEWLIGEALTNLYVGLGRHRRGEKLSAMRFIQQYAVDRLLELSALVETEQPAHKDPFSIERRYEQRFPTLAQELPRFMQGYERNIESAQALLQYLDAHFSVNVAMKQAILQLCA
jgi:hypothetical protein